MTSVSFTTTAFPYNNPANRSSIKEPHPSKSSGTNPNTATGALSRNKDDEKIITALPNSEKSDSETILNATANTVFLNKPIIDGDPTRKRTADLYFSKASDSAAKKRKVQKPETSAERFDNVVLAKSATAKNPIIDVYGRTPEQIKPLQLVSDYMNEYCPIHKKYLNHSNFLIELLEKYQTDSKYKEMPNEEAALELITSQAMEHLDNIVEKDLEKKHPNLSKSDSEKFTDLLIIEICRECSEMDRELVNTFLLELSNI